MRDSDLEVLLRAKTLRGVARGAGCPDESVVAGYFDGGLSDEDRTGFVRHLADCDQCMRLVGFLSRSAEIDRALQAPGELMERALGPANPPPLPKPLELAKPSKPANVVQGPWRHRWLPVAAGLLLVTSVVMWNIQRTTTPIDSPETRLVDPADLAPTILFPTEGAVVDRGMLRIRWEARHPDLFYEVRIVDGDGNLVWQTRLEDTRVLIPEDLDLRQDEDYFVRVSAHLAGGKTLPSHHVGFRVTTDP